MEQVIDNVIENKILLIRGLRVVLDADLAQLYETSTKGLNQAVKRNKDRFPNDFMIQLTEEEVFSLNRSQIVTGSQKHRDTRFAPFAFTEHGVAMLSSVLRSKKAVQMNIFIVRAFIKMRELLSVNKDLAQKIDALERKQREQGDQLSMVYSVVKQLIDEPVKSKAKIGFKPS